MEKKIIDVLERKFDESNIKSRQGGFGKKLRYLEAQIVTRRLNEAFDQNWSFVIKDSQVTADNVYVVVELTVPDGNGGYIVKQAFGGKPIVKKQTLDLAGELKSAGSDGLKKAASLLGIGLDLYGEDEKDSDHKDAPVSAEKGTTDSQHVETEEKISSAQIGAIKAIAKGKGVKNLPEYLTKELKRAMTDDLSGLTKSEASQVITKLNVYKSE